MKNNTIDWETNHFFSSMEDVTDPAFGALQTFGCQFVSYRVYLPMHSFEVSNVPNKKLTFSRRTTFAYKLCRDVETMVEAAKIVEQAI